MMSDNDRLKDYLLPLEPIPTGLTPSGTLTRPVSCILFDIYGTLFISESGDIHRAEDRLSKTDQVSRLLAAHGIDQPADAVQQALLTAIRSRHRSLKAAGVDYPEVEIDRIWMKVLGDTDVRRIRVFAREYEFLVNPVYPMPHLSALLSGIAGRGIPMGIISNAQFFTPGLFDLFLGAPPEGLGFRSDLIFLSHRFGYAKPSQFLYRRAAEQIHRIGVSTTDTLYVGNDMLNDIYPAKSVGFATALFAGDARSLRLRKTEPRCEHLAADLVITDLIQLLDHLK